MADPHSFVALAPSLGASVLLFGANAILRWAFKAQQSSAADLILILMTFDAAILLSGDLQALLARSDHIDLHQVRPAAFTGFVGLLACWGIVVGRLEHSLSRYYTQRATPRGNAANAGIGGFPAIAWCLMWLIGGTSLIMHLYVVGI